MAESRVTLSVLLVLVGLGGCGDDQDPEAANELWDRIHEEQYRTWERAPGWEERRPTHAPHSEEVDIYVNDVVFGVLGGADAHEAWPDGSIIVKDGYDGTVLEIVAAMEKRDGAWFWVEWDGHGDSDYSGRPDICLDCHESGSDYVRAFDLP
jgi:hypothetical protein